MTNPFSDRNNKVTNDIADIISKQRQSKIDAIPDSIKDAAKAAGSEARDAGVIPQETKNTIYNKHFMGAIENDDISTNNRQDFESLADQEFNTSPTE
jgi:hypothetical protein